jgi:SAM-dependent methyltransferase
MVIQYFLRIAMIILSQSFVGNTSACRPYYEMAKVSHFWIQWRFRVFQQRLQQLCEIATLPLMGLDIGCGNGVVREQLEQATSWTIDGTDIIESALWKNQTRRGQTFLYDIHECHPALKEAYDFIILFDVLEHIQNPSQFLHAVVYHVKPGGWLFINAPAGPWLFSRYDAAQNHFRRYHKPMMRTELGQHPLKIQDMRYWGLGLLPFAFMRKFQPSRNYSDEEVLRRGFAPPTAWMNLWLLKWMRAETAHLQNPILGSSLMVFAMKQGE